ncbi:hypothetical protein WA158_000070 [Blastocystis sp. Blastoise]
MTERDYEPKATASQYTKTNPASLPGSIPDQECQKLLDVARPHVESYNFMLDEGLDLAVKDLAPQEVQAEEGGPIVRFWIEKATIGYPVKEDDSIDTRLMPHECRERDLTYASPLTLTVGRSVNHGAVEYIDKKVGNLPLMVKSHKCYLHNMTHEQLVANKEEVWEIGGYFICNGIERLIRLIQMQRRHVMLCLDRPSFQKRGNMYTSKGVSMRCARDDMSTVTITLHYLRDGRATLRFAIKKQEFLVPVVLILKALKQCSDKEIYNHLLRGDNENTYMNDRVELLLRESRQLNLYTQEECLAYLGARFRIMLDLPIGATDVEAGINLIDRFILIHLKNADDKFECLCEMINKLYMFAKGDICADNSDSLMNQEILLPGHLMCIFLKEKFQEFLWGIKGSMYRDIRGKKAVDVCDGAYFRKLVEKQQDIGKKVYYFLATGNIVSSTGLDLMQVSGYTIVAEKLNHWRYLAHFASVHRGQFFTEMKTTAVRKLLPESWGFLCCVHTPDGAPCGLLNHLCAACSLTTKKEEYTDMDKICTQLGMIPVYSTGIIAPYNYLPVEYNGRIMGRIDPLKAEYLATQLRYLKLCPKEDMIAMPIDTEICYIPPDVIKGGQYPGIFISNDAARFIRPVKHIPTGKTEFIGALEQVYLDIACVNEDIKPNITSHIELSPANMLSLIAQLTPFSDFNQSPRNMYQCQMGKQTMGTPTLALKYRTDGKMYRIQTPQAPIVQNQLHSQYLMDSFPQGTNAVVAVIAYTGYDMEDAMIVNKSSFERGFAHASVYKTEVVDLCEEASKGETWVFERPAISAINAKDSSAMRIDSDGLPPIGLHLEQNDIYLATVEKETHRVKYHKHMSTEPCYVEDIRILDTNHTDGIQKVSIKMRYNRNPVVGDKFSSRHGQKGVMSVLWPQIDMPFTETGITPDVIINPNISLLFYIIIYYISI